MSGVQFKVDDVQPCNVRLPTHTYRHPNPTQVGSLHPEVVRRLPYQNALISAVHLAFAKHYPLELSPDVVWLTVLNGVRLHIENNVDKLAPKFGCRAGEEKRRILVVEPMLEGASLDEQRRLWPKVAGLLSRSAMERMDETLASAMSLRFSTSGPNECAALDIALLGCLGSYYSFSVDTECGFPSIRLKGSRRDWSVMREATILVLRELGFARWQRRLSLIMDNCVAAFDGAVDVSFWSGMYKLHGQSESGMPENMVTGWIGHLFPYIEDAENPMLLRDNAKIAPESFPSARRTVPFEWNEFGSHKPMIYRSGIIGVTQDSDLTLSPVIGWSVGPHKRSTSEVLSIGHPLVVEAVKSTSFRRPSPGDDVRLLYREFLTRFYGAAIRDENCLGPLSISFDAFKHALELLPPDDDHM